MLLGGRDIPPFLWEKGGDGNRLSPLFPEIMRKQVSSTRDIIGASFLSISENPIQFAQDGLDLTKWANWIGKYVLDIDELFISFIHNRPS